MARPRASASRCLRSTDTPESSSRAAGGARMPRSLPAARTAAYLTRQRGLHGRPREAPWLETRLRPADRQQGAGEINHFQPLQEETAASEGRRLGIEVEVAFAPASTSSASSRSDCRLLALQPLDAVLTEPANASTLDLVLRELPGKLGLVILSAWGPSVEAAAPGWGAGPAARDGGHRPHPGRRDPGATGPGPPALRRARALRRRAAALLGGPAAPRRVKSQVGPGIRSRRFPPASGRSRTDRGPQRLVPRGQGARPGRAVVAAGNDELALGARRACEALANPSTAASPRRRFLGVDACPTFGQKLVADNHSPRASSPRRTRASPSLTSTGSGPRGRPSPPLVHGGPALAPGNAGASSRRASASRPGTLLLYAGDGSDRIPALT